VRSEPRTSNLWGTGNLTGGVWNEKRVLKLPKGARRVEGVELTNQDVLSPLVKLRRKYDKIIDLNMGQRVAGSSESSRRVEQ